jgi:two-component system chemotaxis response regulator CheB
MMARRDIVVIGASAGGVEALKVVVAGLPAALPAAVFVTLHVPRHGTSVLPQILTRAGALPAVHARDSQAIHPGTIYIAPPDHHLLVNRGYMSLSRGPTENNHRPAVDPLFRSAAHAYGRRVIGVILSGVLDDGTSGFLAIHTRGGIAICQDPDDALYGAMPQNAIQQDHVDHILPAVEIGALLARLTQETVVDEGDGLMSDDDLDDELKFAEGEHAHNPGKPSVFACPACGGTLWEIEEEGIIHFRCRVGHAYGTQTLLAEQTNALEEALWVALRALEESIALSKRMRERAERSGHAQMAERYREQQAEAEQHAALIRQVLTRETTAFNPDTAPVEQPSAGKRSQPKPLD